MKIRIILIGFAILIIISSCVLLMICKKGSQPITDDFRNPIMLQELLFNPGDFNSKKVAVYCYMNIDFDGISLTTVRNSSFDSILKSKKNLLTVFELSVLARKNLPNWGDSLPPLFQNDIHTIENKLVLVKGVYHSNGCEDKGILGHDLPYFQIEKVLLIQSE